MWEELPFQDFLDLIFKEADDEELYKNTVSRARVRGHHLSLSAGVLVSPQWRTSLVI